MTSASHLGQGNPRFRTSAFRLSSCLSHTELQAGPGGHAAKVLDSNTCIPCDTWPSGTACDSTGSKAPQWSCAPAPAVRWGPAYPPPLAQGLR